MATTITARLQANDGTTSIGNQISSFTDLELPTGAQMFTHNPTCTTTGAAIAVGTIDKTKDWRLLIINKEPAASVNDIMVSLDGGTTYPLRVPWGEPLLLNVLIGGVASVFIKSSAGTPEYEIQAVEQEA